MFKRFFKKARQPMGLDIGEHYIRLLQLEQTNAGWRVIAAQCTELPAELRKTPNVLVQAIKQMHAVGSFTTKQVVSCLPATSVVYKNLRLPKMPKSELKSAVHWEAADRLQLTSGKQQIQFFDAGEIQQGADVRQEIILLAAAESVVDAHVDILIQAGLEPVAVDVVPNALNRCAYHFGFDVNDTGSHVILDIGYRSSKVLISQQNKVVFFKLINLGSEHFNQAVAKHLGVTQQEAVNLRQQQLKRNITGGDLQGNHSAIEAPVTLLQQQVGRSLYDALADIASELAKELQLCLRYYNVTFRSPRPEQVWLVGGEARTPVLHSIIAEVANVDVQVADPTESIKSSAVTLEGASCQWAVVCGLACRETRRKVKQGAAA